MFQRREGYDEGVWKSGTRSWMKRWGMNEGNKRKRQDEDNKLQPLQVSMDLGVGYIIKRVNLTNHARTREKVV